MSITTTDNSDISQQPTTDVQPQAQPKRSSRRANTAERRATHNAVERARRETLNSRFLDLAGMLPNLANVRRPSKSAIVNSSIAIIQTQRRNRVAAAREIRLIKAENDAIRQELNEWRQRANLPRVEEPSRSTDFVALLNFDEAAEQAENKFDYNLDEDGDYADDGDEEQSPDTYTAPYPTSTTTIQVPVTHNQQHHALLQHQQAQVQAQAQMVFAQQKAAMARASQAHQQRLSPQQQQQQQQYMYGAPAETLFTSDAFSLSSTVALENAHFWNQKLPTPHLITPPSSAHGHGLSTNKSASPYASTANQAFLAGYNGMFTHHNDDDNLSVGSGSSHHDGSSSHSHLSSGTPEMLMGSSPVDNTFAYAPAAGQGRRPSLTIPTHTYPSPIQQSQYAMGLMI